MKKMNRVFDAREKKLAQELERKARKRRKIAEEARKKYQQDGRAPCEAIVDEDFDEFQARLDQTI